MTFDRNKNILALDFDGVISDSIRECFVVSNNAYAEFAGGIMVDDFDQLDKNHVIESRRLRNFIRSGEDYVYINHAIKLGANIQNQADFDGFCAQHAGLRDTFYRLFYKVRTDLSENSPGLWVRLNPLYDGMQAFLADYEHKENLYIITTKRFSFVDKILHINHIFLPGDNKFTADKVRTKRVIIDEVLKKNTIPPRHFYFVDDQVDTLLKVQELGIHIFLAGWGYNNQEQRQRAQDAGIEVLGMEEFWARFGK